MHRLPPRRPMSIFYAETCQSQRHFDDSVHRPHDLQSGRQVPFRLDSYAVSWRVLIEVPQ
jgi:hypothetical protein